MPKYYPINEETARRAHEAISLSSYAPGSATESYRQAVDEAAALVDKRKAATSKFYHEKLDAYLDIYARRLADWQNRRNANTASCPSVMVCGAGNFPTRKKEKQNARDDALWKEYEEIQSILEKIKSTGTGPIDFADPNARAMLQERVEKLQTQLDRCKAANAHYRKHKTMQGFEGISDEAAAKLDPKIADSWDHKPFPDYHLTSLREKMKRAKERLAEYDRLHEGSAENGTPPEYFENQTTAGQIVQNVAENRLQIIFDSIPDEQTRQALKSHGFRWSPRNQAWQRQFTENAQRAAKEVLGIQ